MYGAYPDDIKKIILKVYVSGPHLIEAIFGHLLFNRIICNDSDTLPEMYWNEFYTI